MSFRDSSGGQWQARSDTAVVQQDSAQIDLAGAIDVAERSRGSDQPAQILTDRLHMDTQTETIRTRSPVTLEWAGSGGAVARPGGQYQGHNLSNWNQASMAKSFTERGQVRARLRLGLAVGTLFAGRAPRARPSPAPSPATRANPR